MLSNVWSVAAYNFCVNFCITECSYIITPYTWSILARKRILTVPDLRKWTVPQPLTYVAFYISRISPPPFSIAYITLSTFIFPYHSQFQLWIDCGTLTKWFTGSFVCTFITNRGTEYRNNCKKRENKHYSTWHARTGKMQLPAFTGCIDLHVTYFRCFALALSINIVYVGYVLRKSGCVSNDEHASYVFFCSLVSWNFFTKFVMKWCWIMLYV
jgi:hypothetical protein